tara:strand:- start:784 stop:888 length:105 start_codon:yes stop_codon:yes gene_type:complete
LLPVVVVDLLNMVAVVVPEVSEQISQDIQEQVIQ